MKFVLGERLIKAASLLSATLRFADNLGCLDWSCATERVRVPLQLERSWSPFAPRQKRLSDAHDEGKEGVRRWLAE